MYIGQYLELQTKYNLNENELNCIIINFTLKNQQLSWAATIGQTKKTKNIQQVSHYFFNKIEVKKLIHEQESIILGVQAIKSDAKEKESKQKDINNKKETDFFFHGDSKELTKENIKQVLEDEFSKITDPEKRTALLIRIADLLSLQNSNNNEVEKPVIYLPEIQPENS